MNRFVLVNKKIKYQEKIGADKFFKHNHNNIYE